MILWGYDFYQMWAAGKLLRLGVPVYDLKNYEQALILLGWPETEMINIIVHPPWTIWLYCLFAGLSANVAFSVEICLQLAAISGSLLLLNRYFKFELNAVTIFCVCTFPPLMAGIILGQIDSLLMFAMILALALRQQGRNFGSGMVLSLTFFKPQLLLMLYLIILLDEVRRRRWQFGAGLGLGFLIQLGGSLYLYPSALTDYFSVRPFNQVFYGATLSQLGAIIFNSAQVTFAISAAGIILTLILLRKRVFTERELLLFVVPLSLLVAPYAWSHSLVLLLPAYLACLSALKIQDSRRGAIGITLFAIVGFIFALDALRFDRYWVLFTLVLTYFWAKRTGPSLDY